MATRPPRKTLSVPVVEASLCSVETASERLENLLGVFQLLITLRTEAHEHHGEMQVYATYLHTSLPRDPNRPDTLIDIDESETFLRFVFNATVVFAVTVLDDLLESLEKVLMGSGDQELVAEANTIIGDRSPKSDRGKSDATQKSAFRKRYVFVSLCLGLMEEQDAWDALKQRMNEPILDKRFAILELYRKRCLIAHDDPFVDMRTNPMDDYGSALRFVGSLIQKWNESFSPTSNHEPTAGTS